MNNNLENSDTGPISLYKIDLNSIDSILINFCSDNYYN